MAGSPIDLRVVFESATNLFAVPCDHLFDTLIKTKAYRKNLPLLSEDEATVIIHTREIFIKYFRNKFNRKIYRTDFDLYTCVFAYISNIFITKLGNLRSEKAAIHIKEVTAAKGDFSPINLESLDEKSLKTQEPSCLYWSVVMNPSPMIKAKFRNNNEILIQGYEWFVAEGGGFEEFNSGAENVAVSLKRWIETYLEYRWRDAYIHKVGPLHKGTYQHKDKPVIDTVTGKPLIDPITNKAVTKRVIERRRFVNPTVRNDNGEEVNQLEQIPAIADIFSSLVESGDMEILDETISEIFGGDVRETEALKRHILEDASISSVITDFQLAKKYRDKVTRNALPKLRVLLLERNFKHKEFRAIKKYLESSQNLEKEFTKIGIDGRGTSVVDENTTHVSIKFLAQQFLPIFQSILRTYEDVTKELIDSNKYKNLSVSKLKEFWENNGRLVVGREVTECLRLLKLSKKNEPPSET